MAAALLLIVVVMRVWLAVVGPLPGDGRAAGLHYQPLTEPLGHIVHLYGYLGVPGIAVMTVLAAALALYRWSGPRAAAGLVLSSGVVILTATLKFLWGPTPLWAMISSGVNFPSGHTAYATSLFGYIALDENLPRRRLVVAGCLIVIIGMGPARVYARSHLVSDVVAGYLLGIAWIIVVTLVMNASYLTPTEVSSA